MKALTVILAAAMTLIAAAPAQAGNWAMFHHDVLHGGGTTETAVNSTSAATLTQIWAFAAGSAVYSSPAIVKNTATGRTVAYVGTNGGNVDAIDTATGTLLWSYPTGKRVDSSPAVVGNRVYVGSENDSLYVLNATTGVKICSYQTTGRIEASPVVANPGGGNVVYVGDEGLTGGDDGGGMWAINATTCALKWHYASFGAPPGSKPTAGVWSPAAFAKTASGTPLVVFGSSSPEGAVYALNATTGARVWRFQTQQFAADEDVGAGPTISPPGSLFASGAVFVSGKDNMVYGLNLANGHKLWQFSIRTDEPSSFATGEPRSTAALVGGKLYVGWGEGLYCLNPLTGAKIWNTAVVNGPTAELISSPAVSGASGHRVVIDGDVNGTLYAWNAQTGKLVKSIAQGTSILGSTAISYGAVYVPDANGNLYAYKPAT